MADLMQQARELSSPEDIAFRLRNLAQNMAAGSEPVARDHQAWKRVEELAEAVAALRAAPDALAERHAAAERDACRWARIAEEHRDGRLAALERVAELEARLRAAPEGYALVPVEPTPERMAAAALAVLAPANGDMELARRAAQIVIQSADAPHGITVDVIAASIATMAPAYRAMTAARPQGVK